MWDREFKIGNLSAIISNAHGRIDEPFLCLSRDQLYESQTSDVSRTIEMFIAYARDITALQLAKEDGFSSQFISVVDLEMIVQCPFASDDEMEKANNELCYRRNPELRPSPTKQQIQLKSPEPGYIYLMKAENGYYKIGRSKNVPARNKQLNREYPIKIEVVHQFWANDYISREKDLHFLFQDKQQEGEWFALESRDIHTIMELQDEEPEPTS